MASKITCTKNYRLFHRNSDNRGLKAKKHKSLYLSMKAYGFLACFPIVCFRDADKHLVVKDGQHRLAIAEDLGLPVYYIIEEVDFDIATINCTSVSWSVRDFAEKHAANGLTVYAEGLEFSDMHGIPVGLSFALLAGTTSFGNIKATFVNGDFKPTGRKWAGVVATLYTKLVSLEPSVRSGRLLQACMGVCRVKDFSVSRMVKNAGRCREKLVTYSTLVANLDMLEGIYNYGHSKLVPLKLTAQETMRKRSAVKHKP